MANTLNEVEKRIIELSTQYASKYDTNEKSHIAAKGYLEGFLEAHAEKNKELKEFAGLVKILLESIDSINEKDIPAIEKFLLKYS